MMNQHIEQCQKDGVNNLIHDKLIDLTIEALKQGHKLDDVTNFIHLLSQINVEQTEIKSLQFGSGNIE